MTDEAADDHELTERDEKDIEQVLDTFEKQSSEVRLLMFEALLANYCHECGDEQPDDPADDCPCLATFEDEDEEDEEDEDEDLDDEDEEDEEDEDEGDEEVE